MIVVTEAGRTLLGRLAHMMHGTPPGWRILGPDEHLAVGDQHLTENGWLDIPPSLAGTRVGDTMMYVPCRRPDEQGSPPAAQAPRYRSIDASWE